MASPTANHSKRLSMKAAVLVPAAGMGRRMGSSVSKQYLELAGKPILAHTLSVFEEHPLVEVIYPIVPVDDFAYCRSQILEPYGFSKVKRLVGGGVERQDSVANGLVALAEDGYTEAQRPVLVHDGARPLFDARLLAGLLTSIEGTGAAIIAVPVKDTIKGVTDMRIDTTLDRRQLWQAQTPQGARFELLQRAFAEAGQDGFYGTDEASLCERIGSPVAVVAGDYRNIKVTTPEDLVIAKALLDSMGRESA